MNDFYSSTMDEQETIINVDYFGRNITFYTSKTSCMRRFLKQFGKPDRIDRVEGKISGITYIVPLFDARIKKILSITNLIGSTYRKEVGE